MTTVTVTNSFEGGTDGSNISVVNSGGASGDAFATIVAAGLSANSGTPNIKYATAAASRGTIGLRGTVAAGVYYLRHDLTSPGGRGGSSLRFLYPGAPAATTTLLSIRNAAGGAIATVQITNAGKIQILNAANTGVAASLSTATVSGKISAGALVGGQRFRIIPASTKGTGTTDGTLGWRLYDSADNLIDSWTSSAQNAGTADPGQMRYYIPDSWATTTYDADEVYFAGSDDSTYWISTAPPPTVNVTVTQGLIDASASVGTGTVTVSITQLTGTTVTPLALGSNRWFPGQQSAATTWRLVATQSDGQTSAPVDVTVAAAATVTAPAVQLLTWNGTTLV